MVDLFKGKINKGIQGYSNIMSKDPRLAAMQGKFCTFQIVEIVTEKPSEGTTVTETKKVK